MRKTWQNLKNNKASCFPKNISESKTTKREEIGTFIKQNLLKKTDCSLEKEKEKEPI